MSQSMVSYDISYGSAEEGSEGLEIDHSEDGSDSVDAIAEAISRQGKGAGSYASHGPKPTVSPSPYQR